MAGALAGLVDKGLVAPDWAEALAPVDDRISAMGQFLWAEIEDVRVLIVGQDPYPTPGHPIGLSFAVDAHVRPLPGSLRNIYQELGTDLGLRMPAHGDLTAWADRGVMLLNRVLTVRPGEAASHRGRGWEEVTSRAIDALALRGGPAAAILWGRDAQSLKAQLGRIPWVESAHPSPLSAARGFFGSRPFSRVNRLLEEQGGTPLDWSLPES
jgi:uracil-DNA glycosylase